MRIVIFFIFLIFASQAFANGTNNYIKLIENKNWEAAKKIESKNLSPMTTWLKLIYGNEINFYELTSFIKKYPKWPRQDALKEMAERVPLEKVKAADILLWFQYNPPKTTNGQLKYIELTSNIKIKEKYAKIIWHEAVLSKEEEKIFLNKYQKLLSTEDHIKRINFMIFNHQPEQATRIINLLPKSLKNLYMLKISLQQRKTSTSNIPKNHLSDIGILYNVAHIHDKNNDEDSLIQTLNIVSNKGKSFQSYFWRLKAKLIRTLIRNKKYNAAYTFASSHGNSDTKEYTDAEWLSGWISLRFLNDPKTAIIHFKNFHQRVKMPMSISRGAYWLGRSYEKLKQKKESNHWYNISAKYFTNFYGQLSLCKINNCNVNIPKEHKITNEDRVKFNNNNLINSALLLQQIPKYNHLTKELLLKAIDNSNNTGEIILITKIKFKNNHFHLATEMAKKAGYKNIMSMKENYPIPKFIYSNHKIDHSLVLSLIRQESVFDQNAISSAGAMGLMQIMPAVAKKTAQNNKIKFNQKMLLSDPNFNSRLGVAHIESLLKEYDNSYILSIAAYNAGSKAVNNWIENNGDPRFMKNEEEIIDWLEKITYHETRNYVQRVLENRAIYYILINKKNKLPNILKPKA